MAEKYYSESTIVRAFRIRKSTLRKMEEEGLISPSMRLGERCYTSDQVADLVFAQNLFRDMGVNWAGVEVALRMRRNMRQLESQMEKIFDYLKRRIIEGSDEE